MTDKYKNKSIISVAPTRIGLSGGGTDIEDYFKYHSGSCINFTINIYVRTLIKKINSTKIHVISNDLNAQWIGKQKDLSKLKKINLVYGVLRFLSEKFKLNYEGVKIQIMSDAPKGSGIGGSSAIVVSLMKGLIEFYGINCTKKDIAKYSYIAERKYSMIPGGKQDQYASVYGGINYFYFNKDDSVSIKKIKINRNIENFINNNILLVYLRNKRESLNIINDQIMRMNNNLNSFKKIKKNNSILYKSLVNNKFNKISEIINNSWKEKKNTSKNISNNLIDGYVKKFLSLGSTGVKISGAGGGGFFLIIIKPELRNEIIKFVKNSKNLNLYLPNLEKKGVFVYLND